MDHPDVTDVDSLLAALRQAAPRRGLTVDSLGEVGPYPLLLLEPRHAARGPVPSLLFAAGFHGEEPAGPWGCLRFLQSAPQELFERADLAFLPAVNPTGLRAGRRRNDWDENPNLGFCPASQPYQAQPSREGALLLAHLPRLMRLARDGFVSLHEDINLDRFYLFTFERSPQPGPFSRMLYQAERQFFEPQPDGALEDYSVQDGLVYRACDGTFEDRLFHEGLARSACTETPGRQPLTERLRANAAIIQATVEFALEPLPLTPPPQAGEDDNKS
jgi:hypothetical protein